MDYKNLPKKENDSMGDIHINNLDIVENNKKDNEIDIFQENENKLDNNKIINQNQNQIITDNNLKSKNDILLEASNQVNNKSYENKNKTKDTLNINMRYNDPIDNNKNKEDFSGEGGDTKNDNDNNNDNDNESKRERNKILLKLLVNKELSRIRTISKELKIPNKKNKNEKLDKCQILSQKQINKNEIENNKIINSKEINKSKNNIIKLNNIEKNIEDNFCNKSKKENALKIIELLKLKNNNTNNTINSFSQNIKEKNRIINININTNHNIITQNDIINEYPKENIIKTKRTILPKKIIKNYKLNINNINNIDNNNYIKNNEVNNEQLLGKINVNKTEIFKKNNIKNIYLNKKMIKYNKNNNLNEIMRRKKLENDLAIEINKNELSGEEWFKDNNNDNNNIFSNKNDEDIKVQEIFFSKELKNNNYNNTTFDKNETIQFPLNDTNNKIYSKKNSMFFKDLKYKTNIYFYQNKKIQKQKLIIDKKYNNNNNQIYNKNIIKPKKKLTNLIPKNNKYNIENKKILIKKNNSSFDNKINYQNNNDTNSIYIKKNLINNYPEKIIKNKSVKNINKYNYNQNDILNNYLNNQKLNNNNYDDNNINNLQSLINKNQNNILLIIEELLVLEDMLKEIIISLNRDKYIANYCFEFWNYFYNSLIFSKFDKIFKDFKNINSIKLSINLILFAIMICYDFSFESNKLINIYLFLSEILELDYKNLVLILEEFSNIIIFNNKNNNWIIRAINLINNYNITEDNENLNNNNNYNEVILFKIKVNINLLIQKINYILLTNKTNFNECLLKIFNRIKNVSFMYIDNFFKEYLLRENYIECSITALTFLKEKLILETESAPYIKNKNKKKFSLVLDLDETLINFKINKEKNDEGVLKLRPYLNKFLENVMKYYEIILFTEASQSYSELLINALEENKKYFEYKFYRQHTVIIGNDFIKDLTRIGRPLNSIIIIDNMPQNFRLQKSNGINIKSFFGEDNDEDNTLIDLMRILINIVKEEDDVRKGLIKYHEEIITKITSNIYKHNKF